MSKLLKAKEWARKRLAASGRLSANRSSARPKLSIVVPVYNVEPYLAECLESILAQPYADREVIMVDDGSTDASGEIARRFASSHPGFRLITQANAGLGAARNTGVRHARGEYLTFLDSDDVLPADAFSAMMATIEESGSDFAIGMLKRDEEGRRYAMPRMRDNHRVRRVAVTLDEMPRILADVFAVNKVFRRSFWDEARLSFPTDTRYEDQPTLTQAFLAAKTFDVLRETVYLWRIRGDGSSITQRRHDIADLHDRIVTKRTSTEMVMARAPHLRDLWLSDILPVDMWEYFRAVPGCSDEFWELLRAALAEFWSEDTVPFESTWVPVQQRLMGWLVVHERREELERLIAYLDERAGDIPVQLRDDRVVALLPGVEDPSAGLPEKTYVLAAHELRWETRITNASWRDGQLHLSGFALIRNVPTQGSSTELAGHLSGPTDPQTGTPVVVALALEPVSQPRATKFADRPSQNYDDCGFKCSIDIQDVVAAYPGPATWRLFLERRVEKVCGSGEVTSFDRPHVDRSWHEIDLRGSAVAARLHEADGDLVFQVRPA